MNTNNTNPPAQQNLPDELQDMNSRLQEKLDIISGLANEYTALYYVDLDNGTYKNYVATDKIADTASTFAAFPNWEDLFSHFIDSEAVHPDSRESLRRLFGNAQCVRNSLKNKKRIRTTFLRKYGQEYLWTEMSVIKSDDINEEAHTVVVGFIECEAEMQTEKTQQKCLEILSRDDSSSESIDELLSLMGKYYAAERAYVFEYAKKREILSNTYEWCADGIPAMKDKLQNVPSIEITGWLSEFKRQGAFCIDTLDTDGVYNTPEGRALLEMQGIQSIIAAPIMLNGHIEGLLGVDNPRQAKRNTALLKTAASIAYSKILRRRETEASSKFIDSLLGSYNIVYKIQLTDASFDLLKMDDNIIGKGMDFPDFFKARDYFIDHIAYATDRSLLRHEMDFTTIRNRLQSESTYSVDYRAVVNDVAIWHKMVMFSLGNDEIAICFLVNDAPILNEHIRKALIDKYDAVYVANLNEDQIKILKASGIMKNQPPVVTYSTMVKKFAASLDDGEARAHFMAAADPEYEKQTLKKDGKIEFVYLSPNYGEKKVWLKSETQVLTWDGDLPETAVIGITGVDSLQREKIELNEHLAETLAFTNYFLGTYVSAYYVGLDDLSCQVYRRSRQLEEDYPIVTNYLDSLTEYITRDVHPDDRDEFLRMVSPEHLRSVLAKQPEFTHVFRDISNGCEKTYRFQAIRGADDAHIAFGFIDITKELHRQQEQHRQLAEALAMAESANKAKTEFLFNMSHDIRTPMNAILGFTGMAMKHLHDQDKVKDCLVKTQQSGNLLLSLINSVLDMSRIEAGNADVHENPGDVYFSFVNIDSALKEIASTKDITLTFEFGTILDRYVFADFQRCMRIFTNLIANAIKYSHEGGYVKVRCEQTAPQKDGIAFYRYTIADNGIGMSEDFQKHMFEAFTREHSSTTSGIQGTGLGLSVCKTFVDYLHGSIECDSKLGVGTTFTVTLPFRIQKSKQYTNPTTGEIVSEHTQKVTNLPGNLHDRKVLLVEDNELNREIAVEILEEEGLLVDEAEDGSVAVKKLTEKGPAFYDFILMDIQMPVMNGYEATKAIRNMYPDARLPIIAVSANAFEEDKKASRAAGMDDHVAKPINVKELLAVLAKFVS